MTVTVIGENTGDDFTGTEDNQIAGTGDADTNFETGDPLPITNWAAGDTRHLLINFPGLSNISAPVTVSVASLDLYLVDLANTLFFDISLFRLLRDWHPAQATWDDYITSTGWGTAGALNTTTDIDAVASSLLEVNDTTGEYKTWTGLETDVQDFINGDEDTNGWLARRTDGISNNEKRFTAQNGTDGQRPFLTVTHEAAAGNIAACAHHLRHNCGAGL